MPGAHRAARIAGEPRLGRPGLENTLYHCSQQPLPPEIGCAGDSGALGRRTSQLETHREAVSYGKDSGQLYLGTSLACLLLLVNSSVLIRWGKSLTKPAQLLKVVINIVAMLLMTHSQSFF